MFLGKILRFFNILKGYFVILRVYVAFFIAFMWAEKTYASPQQSGIHCSQVHTEIEKIVCSDPTLLQQDHAMGKAFSEVKDALPPHMYQDFIQDQKEWLKLYRTDGALSKSDPFPKKKQTIKALYQDRLKDIAWYNPHSSPYWTLLSRDPNFSVDQKIQALLKLSADKEGHETLYHLTKDFNRDQLSNLSCTFFEKHPVQAQDLFGAYFGSSQDSWIPLCPKRLSDEISTLKVLRESLDNISPAMKDQFCTGSIAHSYRRSMVLADLMGIYAPVLSIPPLADIKKEFPHPENLKPEDFLQPFKKWSRENAWKLQAYQRLIPQVQAAYDTIFSFYEKEKKIPVDNAKAYAAHTLYEIVKAASAELASLLDGQETIASPAEKDSPLLYAVAGQDKKAVERLLSGQSGKVDVNISDQTGKTALSLAVQGKDPWFVERLLKVGADPNKASSPLEDGDNGCDRPLNDQASETPLMKAMTQGNQEVIQALMKAGANPYLKNSEGSTSFYYLKNSSFPQDQKDQIQALLKAYPKKTD
jgi:uncharacterized protein